MVSEWNKVVLYAFYGWTDGQTDTASYRDARTHLKMMWGWFVSGITLYCRLFTKALRTDGQTDGPTEQQQPTDGRTDTASYRDARTHLKMM